jgi:hypothetical protein
MGKMLRGSLWVLFPPAGWLASRRATSRRRHAELVSAVSGAASSREPATATPDELADRRELIEALTRTANNASATPKMRRHAEEKLRLLGQ